MPKKNTKPMSCELCEGESLTRRVTTYPVRLTEAAGKLAGKEIHIHRVALHQCETCGHLMPTPVGMAKVQRCIGTTMGFLLDASR